jgi:SAM-dependent methyltransferase
VRDYWNEDAATYDHDPGHHPISALENAAWGGTLESLLPPAPSRILDVGAGTGFLTLMASELGHDVTAVDLSPGMLGRLKAKAAGARLPVTVVEADAVAVPAGPFDVVMSRHLLWTLPDPLAALRAWLGAAPQGRLVLVDSHGDGGTDPTQLLLRWGRRELARVRRTPASHHAPYSPEILAALPLGNGTSPERILELVAEAGWGAPRLRQLTDVDWAARRSMPWPERLLGAVPHFAVLADGRTPPAVSGPE